VQNLERKEGQNDHDGSTCQECDQLRLLAWQNMANVLVPIRPSIEDSTFRTIAILKVEVGLASATAQWVARVKEKRTNRAPQKVMNSKRVAYGTMVN